MKDIKTNIIYYKNAVFLASLLVMTGGTLLSVGFAQAGYPVVAWTLFYVNIGCIFVVLLLGADSLIRAVVRIVRGESVISCRAHRDNCLSGD